MKRRFVLAGLMIAWFVTGAFAPVAPPNPPVTPKDTAVSLVSSFDSPTAWCTTQFPPGFVVRTSTTGTALFHVAGDKIVVTQARSRITWTNVANGRSVWTPSVGNWTMQPDANGNLVVTMSSGILQRIVVPGEGVVSADVGKIYMTVSAEKGKGSTISGGHQPLGMSAYDAICEAIH